MGNIKTFLPTGKKTVENQGPNSVMALVQVGFT